MARAEVAKSHFLKSIDAYSRSDFQKDAIMMEEKLWPTRWSNSNEFNLITELFSFFETLASNKPRLLMHWGGHKLPKLALWRGRGCLLYVCFLVRVLFLMIPWYFLEFSEFFSKGKTYFIWPCKNWYISLRNTCVVIISISTRSKNEVNGVLSFFNGQSPKQFM